MIKNNKIDYKLINIAIVALIVYLMYQTGHLWLDAFSKFIGIIAPFVVAFALAYALQPFVNKLMEKKIPKGISVAIVIIAVFGLLILVGYIITSVLVGQLNDLFGSINNFLTELSEMEWNINIEGLQTSINQTFQEIIADVTKVISNGALNLIGSSINFLGKMFIGLAAFIYFLIDMDKIRIEIKKFFRKQGERTYKFIKILDEEMRNYLSGLVQIMLISVIEYGIAYAIIGHPNAILLGFLAGFANLIPYFGGIMCNVLASITAFVISPALFIRTIITFVVLSSVDSYLINPRVYGKTNSIHPLLIIFAMFAGSALFGIIGVFISFPVAIIMVAAYKYYKKDINEGIREFKDKQREEA